MSEVPLYLEDGEGLGDAVHDLEGGLRTEYARKHINIYMYIHINIQTSIYIYIYIYMYINMRKMHADMRESERQGPEIPRGW